jgi:hypothetical protein
MVNLILVILSLYLIARLTELLGLEGLLLGFILATCIICLLLCREGREW